jgi:hypothetical protein
MDALNNICGSNYLNWKLMFCLVVVFLIVNAGGSALTKFEPLRILKLASSMMVENNCSSWMYMTFIRKLFKNTNWSILFFQTKAESLLKRIYSNSFDSMELKNLLHDIQNLATSEVYLDPIHLYLDILKSALEAGQLLDAKILIERIESLVIPSWNVELDLLFQFEKEKWIVKSGETSHKPFANMVRVTGKIIQLGMEYSGLDCGIDFWNLILGTFNAEFPPELIHSMELMNRYLDQLTKVDAAKIQTLIKLEIAKHHGEIALDPALSGDDRVNGRIANLLSIAASLEMDEALLLYLEAFKTLDPAYSFQTCHLRVEDRPIKKSAPDSAPYFRAIAKAVYEILSSPSQHSSANGQYWDMVYAACLYVDDKEYLNPLERFEILGIKLECLFICFHPQLLPEHLPKFNHLTMMTIWHSFSIAKELRKLWMLSNCVIRFWRLYCLSNGNLFNESWTEIISELIQYYSTEELRNTNDFILISCMYVNNQLDNHSISQSKTNTNSKTNNSKESPTNFQKNAEDAIRTCFVMRTDVDMSLLLHLLPAWNRLQQLKTGNASTSSSLEFEDPILKSLATFESISVSKSDSAKNGSVSDMGEEAYLGIQAIEGSPTLLRIKMYQKLAKQGLQDNDPIYTIGVLRKILSLCKEFTNEYSGQTIYLNTWCWLTQLDALKVYLELVETNSSAYQDEPIMVSIAIYKDMITTATNFFPVLLRSYWNYTQRYLDSCLPLSAANITYNFSLSIFKLYSMNPQFKAMLDSLNASDFELIRDMLTCLLKFFQDREDEKKAKKLLDIALRVIPQELRGPLLGLAGHSTHKEKDICLITHVDAITQANSIEERNTIAEKCKELIDHGQTPPMIISLYHMRCILHGIETEVPSNLLKKITAESENHHEKEGLPWLQLVLNLYQYSKSREESLRKTIVLLGTHILEKLISRYNKIMESKASNQKQGKGKKDPQNTNEGNPQISFPIVWDTFMVPKGFADTLHVDHESNKILEPIMGNVERLLTLLQRYLLTTIEIPEAVPILLLGEFLCDLCLSHKKQLYPMYFYLEHAKRLDSSYPGSLVALDYYALTLENFPLPAESTDEFNDDVASFLFETCHNLTYFGIYTKASSLLKTALIFTNSVEVRQEAVLQLAYLAMRSGDFILAKHYLIQSLSDSDSIDLIVKINVLDVFVQLNLVNNSSDISTLLKRLIDCVHTHKLDSTCGNTPIIQKAKCCVLWVMQYLEGKKNTREILEAFGFMEGAQEWVTSADAYLNFLYTELDAGMCEELALSLNYFLVKGQSLLSTENLHQLLILRTIIQLKLLVTKSESSEGLMNPLDKYLMDTGPQKSQKTISSNDTIQSLLIEYMALDPDNLNMELKFGIITLKALTDSGQTDMEEEYLECLLSLTTSQSSCTLMFLLYSVEAVLNNVVLSLKQQIILSLYLQELKSHRYFEDNVCRQLTSVTRQKVIEMINEGLSELFERRMTLEKKTTTAGKPLSLPILQKYFEPSRV